MTPLEVKLTAIVEPIIDEIGFELVRMRLTGANVKTLQIMAERPDGTMTAQDCAILSRAISAVFEEVDPIADKYMLEVSSPGIDRPLTRLKDFDRWDGFVAKLELTQVVEGQKRFRGTLAGIEDDNVLIDLEGEEDTALIPFSLIGTAKLIMTDELVTESLSRAKAASKTDPAGLGTPEGDPEEDHVAEDDDPENEETPAD